MYQGSRKGKARRSTTFCTLPCADTAEEPSPSEGVGERSLLFCEEEEAMEQWCSKKREVRGVKDREEVTKEKNRKEEGEFEKNISGSEKMA